MTRYDFNQEREKMSRKSKCKLCKIKRPHWEEGSFFGVRCKNKHVPIIMLKEHKKNLNKSEQEELKSLLNTKFDGWFPNKSLNASTEHCNLYLTKKG